jgi:hypothetical protein
MHSDGFKPIAMMYKHKISFLPSLRPVTERADQRSVVWVSRRSALKFALGMAASFDYAQDDKCSRPYERTARAEGNALIERLINTYIIALYSLGLLMLCLFFNGINELPLVGCLRTLTAMTLL